MAQSSPMLLAFYGDDFTGSTDALEFLSKAGVKTMLFIEPPTAEQLSRYDGLQAIGVAGITRAMAPAQMETTLQSAFNALKALRVSHVHYKVCSTFDSSPQTGSIGKAIAIGAAIFKNKFTPLLVGAPALGRYCLFGNLFARMGIGSRGDIYRLDRHPSMSKHPVTPADESDLRLHLAKQTDKKIGLIDILDIEQPEGAIKQKIKNLNDSGNEIILFDALTEPQLQTIGSLLAKAADQEGTLFSVGSSGIEMALGAYWQKQGVLQAAIEWKPAGNAAPILVISGSCSPVTSRQIAWGLAYGFMEIALDTGALSNAKDIGEAVRTTVKRVASLIQLGKNVIVHTSNGDDDPRLTKTRGRMLKSGAQSARILGTALGLIAKEVAGQTDLKRILIAGGDTSGFAARAMGIEAVEMICPLAPGAPLCRAYAPGSAIDGLEVNFKGGQVGDEDYFGSVLQGRLKL